MKNKTLIWVLIIYTILNIKFLWPFIFNKDSIFIIATQQGTSLLGIFLSIFLNTVLIVYCINKNLFDKI